jgi:hypothetical protein
MCVQGEKDFFTLDDYRFLHSLLFELDNGDINKAKKMIDNYENTDNIIKILGGRIWKYVEH